MILKVGDAATTNSFPDDFFTLTIGSPPYLGARTYSREDISKKAIEWSKWMLQCTISALRVTNGPVLWVVSGTGATDYQPGPELLVAEMYHQYPDVHILRPNIWTKNAAPTGKGWFSNDWEYVLAFAKKVPLPTWNPQELATPLKYKTGGHFRQRKKSGDRSQGSDYPTHEMRKRPSNVHYVTVGGGHMGWDKATEYNEAPFPEKLVARFIRVLTNPGDNVYDPFCGSGTTPRVAEILGRIGYGVDIRPDQIIKAAECQEYIDEVRKANAESDRGAVMPVHSDETVG